MFSEKFTVPTNEDGEVLMDRDPELFELLIGFLRLPERKEIYVKNEEIKQRLLAEFNYWCIEPPTIKTFADRINEFKADFELTDIDHSTPFKVESSDNKFGSNAPLDFKNCREEVLKNGWLEPKIKKITIDYNHR